MKLLLHIAWRNIWRNPVRSVVIIISVILGLWAGTFVNALYFGVGEDRIRIAIESEVSHIQLHHPGFKDDYKAAFSFPADTATRRILENQQEIRTYSLRSMAQGMLTTPGSSSGVYFIGVDSDAEDSTTHLGANIIEGNYFIPEKKHQILVGYKLAKKLKLRVKSKVVLSCLDREDDIATAAFKVAGIYRSGNSARDEMNIYIRRNELNDMLGLGNQAHEMAILLHNNQMLEKSTSKLKKAFPALTTETWKEVSPETDLIITTMSQVSRIVIIIILFALSFGIINTMLMAILERTREIGMMIALGMTRVKIFILILLETLLLVMIGCPIGLSVAWLTIEYFGKHGIDISSSSGEAMSSFGMSTVMYPALPAGTYMEIILLIIIAAVLSALFPAIKAVKLRPAETLKS